MAKPFKNLLEAIPPKRRTKIDMLTQELLTHMPSEELQRAQELTRQQVASSLSLEQADVEKIEADIDLYFHTLKRFITTMGGELEIIARFPQGNVIINDLQHREELTQK